MSPTIHRELVSPIAWGKYLVTACIVSFLLAVFVPLVSTILEEVYTPRDYWFTYHAVRPTKSVYRIGEDLTFYSVREVRKTAKYEWHDTLRCNTNGEEGVGDRTFSIYEAGKVLQPHRIDFPGGVWTYRAPAPRVPAVCYLISTTTAKLRYTDKVQTLKTRTFEIR